MATKTISITEEAYERLKMKKEKNESFSDVINKITGRRSLLEIAGILSNEEADLLRNHIKDLHSRSAERVDKTRNALK